MATSTNSHDDDRSDDGDDTGAGDGAASDDADADYADDDDVAFASVMKVLDGVRHARAADARGWPAE
eukprot:6430047-Pyramimonas_sp.AAC.1